jgi:hypothetical protein
MTEEEARSVEAGYRDWGIVAKVIQAEWDPTEYGVEYSIDQGHRPRPEDLLTYEDIALERQRQEAKWGTQDHDPLQWITILGEEYGEACRGAYEFWRNGSPDGLSQYKEELVQVAAVAVAALGTLARLEHAAEELAQQEGMA